jgi:hypothetical protein
MELAAIKRRAKQMKVELRKLNPTVKLSQVYEELAYLAGFSTWNHYCAWLKKQEEFNGNN